MARTTALGIPCPWSGDETEPAPRTYRAWVWLYATTRRLRHRISLHDYERWGIDGGRRCTWCGKHNA
ncbi:hypothetical protein ACFWNQ_24985 [Streptomyces virginiae]|uniref:hypothetical protein n=1 Tax=Streptomyces virginiae TaxID=1961 RepID=UPI00364D6945